MRVEKYENRLIAFLDVLGFSSRLAKEDLALLHEQYSSFIDEAKTATFYGAQGDNTGRHNFAFAQFLFDSIVVVSHPVNDPYNCNHFIGAISLLLELGFKAGLPLRGAVNVGSFLYDQKRNIFLSEAFPQVVKAEGKQEWTGCTILEEAESIVISAIFGSSGIDSQNQTRNQLVHRYFPPCKDDRLIGSIVINYLFFLSEKEIEKGIAGLIDQKQVNTRNYFEFLRDLPMEIQNLPEGFLPANYVTMIKTRTGMRAQFIDEAGEACQPGVEEFTWTAIGRWRE